MKTKHVWSFTALAVMAAILFGTAVLGVLPTLADIQGIDSQRQAILQENEVRKAFLDKLKSTATDKEALFVALSKQRDLFPSNLNAVEFMNEINDLSQTTGVAIANFSVSAQQPFTAPTPATNAQAFDQAVALLAGSSLSVSEVALTLRGTTAQLQSFMSKMHDGVRYALIYSAVMPNGAGANSNQAIAIDLQAEIFTLRTNG